MRKKLADISEVDKNQFGLKAFMLGRLIREGFNVPTGYALTSAQDASFDSGKLWVVRSSAHDEDSEESSRAGHYKSYLNVRDVKAQVEQSLAEQRLASVIVQEMIESDFGGVCFSSFEDDTVQVETCLGHNSGVTQGFGKVARLSISDDREEIDDPHGLLSQVSKQSLIDVAYQAKKIERNFGCAVDVEWCVRGQEIFILQARQITGDSTLRKMESIKAETLRALHEDVKRLGFGMWTDFSIGDMFRHPSTLFLDLVNHDHGREWSVRRVYTDLGLKPAEVAPGPLFVSICDRAYIHVGNYFETLFPKSVFVPTKSGIKRRSGSWLSTCAQIVRLTKTPLRIHALRKSLVKKYDQEQLRKMMREARTLATRDYASMSLEELFSAFDEINKRLSAEIIYAHLLSDVLAGASQAVLKLCLRVLFSDAADYWECRLTTGLRHNFNTESMLSLFDVAQGKMTLATYIEEFGHRGNPDWDIASKRWREEPEKVKHMAESMRCSKADPRALFEKQVKAREEAEESLFKHLGETWMRRRVRTFVMRQLAHYQSLSPLREQTQSVVYAFIEALRMVILAIASKTKLGDDIFELSLAEFEALRVDAHHGERSEAIQSRPESTKLLSRRVHLPHVFGDTDLGPELFKPKSRASESSLLRGTRVSCGIISGKARVVEDLSQVSNLSLDEIIVARYADPSHAALLMSAGGLVLEQGSVLSHTAIIARELGLPAIVNVDEATLRIVDGQRLRLDADKGELWIESGYGATSSPSALMT